MGHCNLEMTNDCYGCAYHAAGDFEGCKLTIQYHKEHMEDKGISYAEWMLSQGRTSDGDIEQYQPEEFKNKKRLLFADLDGTLIETVSGESFPKGIWDM